MPRVGLISDTHGLLRPEATAFLRGSDLIIHAGDIGDADVLAELATLAPVTAVRGNNDRGAWADAVPEATTVRVDDVDIHVVHDLADLDRNSLAGGVRVVVSGHSHRPAVGERDGLMLVNPGSAGPRRFSLPIAVGELRITGASVRARLVELEVSSARDLSLAPDGQSPSEAPLPARSRSAARSARGGGVRGQPRRSSR